jgi:hypothetical protein
MNQSELSDSVIELCARQAILDCLMRYSRGVDRLDRELILSAYHPDAVDDHGMFVGNPDEFADWVIGMHSGAHVSHQHCLFNHSCELAGEQAHAETYFMFIGMNRTSPSFAMSGGRYIDRFEKRDGRWAIASRVCVRDWTPSAEPPDLADPSTLTAVSAALSPAVLSFMRGAAQSSRDRTDPSYLRPLTIDHDRIRSGRELH